jgi:hypothetical protein
MTIPNPNYNPNDPNSQKFIFDQPTQINQQTGQLSSGGYATPSINASSLEPVSGLPYVNPDKSVASFPILPVAPADVATPQTDAVSKMIADLTASSGLGADEAAYRVEQEKTAGIADLNKVVQDYTNQYNQLKADYANVEPTVINKSIGNMDLHQQSLMTEAEQRKILVKSNTVTALLAAAQGNVTFAQSQIDKAVNDKFAVPEAERKAKLANLDLLLKDPKIDEETKTKAAATAAKLKIEADTEAKKKTDTATILGYAKELATNPVVAQQIANIGLSDNPDLGKAFKLYSENGGGKIEGGADITEFKQFFPNADLTTMAGQQQFLNWKAKVAGAGSETTTKNIFMETQTTLQQYKEQGYTRQQVEDEWKKQNAASGQDPTTVELPLTVKSGLDAIYGTTPIVPATPTKVFHWYNPLTWF